MQDRPRTAPNLFSPIAVGPLKLPNRVVMAPLTRSRAARGNVPTLLNALYYAQRASAGITVPGAGGPPAQIPVTPPELEFRGSGPGILSIRMVNVELPDSRKLPDGAQNWELWGAVGDTPTADPAAAAFRGTFTRIIQPSIEVAPSEVGKWLSLFARYCAPSKAAGPKIGPWSLPLQIVGQ